MGPTERVKCSVCITLARAKAFRITERYPVPTFRYISKPALYE